ncbi:hypothetical protein SAMN02982922_5398 [Mesorhizobium australicum]|uniref:Uncharacterized protein n=1 Tax=Mesorhizobium australicum TaxID=536018 RepID=A0A1X7PUF8_9HYPH|nr:hypothetical protein SAMN02982922_5398 [Mesorhizobium australicum]
MRQPQSQGPAPAKQWTVRLKQVRYYMKVSDRKRPIAVVRTAAANLGLAFERRLNFGLNVAVSSQSVFGIATSMVNLASGRIALER